MKKGDKLTTVSHLGILHIKKYSDYTLMNMRKDELIRYIRMVESNYESLNIQYENAVNANLEKFADFENVIRCKDCKHYQGLAECELIGECGGTDFYCGWAERREK